MIRLTAPLLAALIVGGCGDRDAAPAAGESNAIAPAPAAIEGVQRYRIGEASVTALLDGRGPFPANLFAGIPQPEVERLLRAGGEATQGEDGKLAWQGTVWAFLVEVGGRRVLVDTGAGGSMPGMNGVSGRLAAAGVTPGQIDAIVISHMHGDHIGGLLNASGQPVYPRATLHMHADEAGYWGSESRAAEAPQGERSGFETARRILAAYQPRLRTFTAPTEIVPGFSAEPLIGHTPGHTVYRLRSGTGEMAFIGDMIHSLAVQMPRPEASLQFDNDLTAARTARDAFLRDNVGRAVSFAGPHFRPGIVTIARDGEGHRATPVAPTG